MKDVEVELKSFNKAQLMKTIDILSLIVKFKILVIQSQLHEETKDNVLIMMKFFNMNTFGDKLKKQMENKKKAINQKNELL